MLLIWIYNSDWMHGKHLWRTAYEVNPMRFHQVRSSHIAFVAVVIFNIIMLWNWVGLEMMKEPHFF